MFTFNLEPHSTYQNTGTLFYHTTNNATALPPSAGPLPADSRSSAIIYTPYNLPIRQGFHLEMPSATSVTNSKTEVSGHKPGGHQVYHINLDQAPANQPSGSMPTNTAQLGKPQITMEKIADRYQVDVKHEGAKPASAHGSMPSNQMTENVVYTPIIQGLQLHPNVVQINNSTNQVNN